MSSESPERIVVADSGPLIAFALIEQLDLLPRLHSEILIPEALFAEVTERGDERPGAREITGVPWLRRVTVTPPPDDYLRAELGAGEAEAIALAVRVGPAVLLMDDLEARHIAQHVYQLRVRGVVGTLVLARRRALIPALRPLCERLVAGGYRLQASLVDNACRQVGE